MYYILASFVLLLLNLEGIISSEGACSVAGTGECERQKTCPKEWPMENCLGTGPPAAGKLKSRGSDEESITWKEGMTGHTHYSLPTSRTAVFVIDPQRVYSACPDRCDDCPLGYKLEDLIAAPGSEEYSRQSPLCCEKFGEATANINKITKKARYLGIPVFMHAHVYREGADTSGRIDDFDVLGWAGWPKAFNLWHESLPYSDMIYRNIDASTGVDADFERDFYCEKTSYSAMTEPVLEKLHSLNIDTIIVTGFMTNYCAVTTSRAAHDLGFKVVYVEDACDGPVLLQMLSGIDENAAIPFYLGVSVADVTVTDDVVSRMGT